MVDNHPKPKWVGYDVDLLHIVRDKTTISIPIDNEDGDDAEIIVQTFLDHINRALTFEERPSLYKHIKAQYLDGTVMISIAHTKNTTINHKLESFLETYAIHYVKIK